MESYIPISFLNDFIFCPRSIYFHQLYGNMKQQMYCSPAQVRGKIAHKSVDEKKYSTSKNILQSIEIYCERYGLAGKIDIFDSREKSLVERKKKIRVIYDGYVFQLYAQYHCLTEMGHDIDSLKLYSFDDNRTYPVNLPCDDLDMQNKFKSLLLKIRDFDLDAPFEPQFNKCKHCVYSNLCDKTLC